MIVLPRIPSEYQEVEYIESSGTQYINTGINASKDIGFAMNVRVKAYGSELGVLATTKSTPTPAIHYVLQAHNNALRLYLSTASGQIPNVFYYQTDTTTFHDVQYNVDNDFKSYYDGELKGTSSATDTPDIPYPLVIFARSYNGAVRNFSSCILKYLKLYNSGVLVRDFVPCYRKSDDEIGMYDKVSKIFFTNQGTGTFTKGADVELPTIESITIDNKQVKKIEDTDGHTWWERASNYTFVDYIESNGDEYINTNFVPNQDTKVETKIKTKTVSGSANRTIFGSRSGANSNHYGMTIGGNNCWWLGYGTTNGNTMQAVSSDTIYEITKNKNATTINGTDMTPATAQTFTCPGNMYLFCMNQSGATAKSSIKLYSCKIYDNGTLIRDYKPCYRNSDNVVGLLDEVNDVFYENAGTGAFTYGND